MAAHFVFDKAPYTRLFRFMHVPMEKDLYGHMIRHRCSYLFIACTNGKTYADTVETIICGETCLVSLGLSESIV